MGSSQNTRRFRVNPVELAIFSIVTLIFLNSVYNLFYDRQGFHATALAPMAANPISEGRTPASVPRSFQNLDLKCEMPAGDQDTQAAKVRLNGTLCGSTIGMDETKLIKTQVTNIANKFTATVFTDLSSSKYSTDYIPLNAGKNPVHIEFFYQGGKQVTRDLTINKN
jgi:hypothetical protein